MSDQLPFSTLPNQIQFVAYHRPALEDGVYYIEVTPGLSTAGIPRIIAGTKRKHFQISGTRFGLQPQEVHTVFPPDNSLGDHENVLPHIVLKRSTLPWERKTDGTSENIPWLALLVFDSIDNLPKPQVISFLQLKQEATAKRFPAIDNEVGQQDSDQLIIIDVKKELLEKILPSKDDLEYLAHVRQGFDAHGKMSGGEYAVIIANRLPMKEGISKVHLVSLENRFSGNTFDYQGANPSDTVRLISLYSWQFACINPKQSFSGLLENLNTEAGSPSGHNLRLPSVNHPSADNLLSLGYVPLHHLMRNGDKSVSWYHSPLASGINPNHADVLPVLASDALLRFDSRNGMFDVSYAAAWELGRMLVLQSKAVSVSLYNWKCSHAQKSKMAELQLAHSHLPAQGLFEDRDKTLEIPTQVRKWFQNLSLLKGVPFNYLVPDARMLPVESIRFFVIDNEWVECMLDGAFSVGRIVGDDLNQDQKHHNPDDDAAPNPAQNPFSLLSGFIMRSAVVSGYSDFHVDAYQPQSVVSLSQATITVLNNAAKTDAQLQIALKTDFKTQQLTAVTEIDNEQWLVHILDKDEQYAIRKIGNSYQVQLKNKLIRREKLSDNVLLCIFEGMIEEVDMYQKPETLHFGLDRTIDAKETYFKQLKNRAGDPLPDASISPLKFRKDDSASRVLDIADLANRIKAKLSWNVIDSAFFAIEMTEGVERIRFKKGN